MRFTGRLDGNVHAGSGPSRLAMNTLALALKLRIIMFPLGLVLAGKMGAVSFL